MSFRRDTKSLWSLLSGVYARGSKRSHTGGKCVTWCGLTNTRWTLNTLQRAPSSIWEKERKERDLCDRVTHVDCVFSELIKEVLSKDEQIHTLAQELYKQRSLLVMGRGFNYATCLEGALVRARVTPLG